MTVQEDERRRIALDLHDQLGQQITARSLSLDSATQSLGNKKKLQQQLEATRAILTRLDRELGFLAWELRPAALEEIGLVTSLANFVQEWSKNYKTPAEFHTSRLNHQRLGDEIETNLYRIAQEALNNVYKHAQASRVSVILERRDGHAVLIVEDDGRGFDPRNQAQNDSHDRGMGLVSMHERAAHIGGQMELESAPGKGTTVYVRTPLPEDDQEPQEGRRNDLACWRIMPLSHPPGRAIPARLEASHRDRVHLPDRARSTARTLAERRRNR